jgi:hypothetical protein
MPDLDAAPAAPSLELGKSQRKILASAGHLMERFAAACDGLRARVQDGRIPLPEPWRSAVLAMDPVSLGGDGWFVIRFTVTEDGKPKMLSRLPSPDEAEQGIAAWLQENPASAKEPLLSLPESLNAPVWLALLRLRQLRDFWEPELRRSGLDHFLALLPDAWLLDPTPLPPGAVIPRLEIASWDELETLASVGRKFATHPVHDGQASVLVEADFDESSPGIQVIYAKKGARVDMVGFMGKARP